MAAAPTGTRGAPGTGARPAPRISPPTARNQTRTAPPDGARWIARETVRPARWTSYRHHCPPARQPPARPIGTPSAATPAPDGQTRYWLDQDARLHKLVTRLPGVGPVTMIFNRADRPTLGRWTHSAAAPVCPAR